MIAFNHVVPVICRCSTSDGHRRFAFEQSKRATIGGRFIRVDESRDLPLLHVVEILPRNRYAALLLRRRDKIDSAAPAVDGPVQIRPAAIDLHVGFHPCATGKDRKGYASTSAAVFHFRAHNAEPSGKSWVSTFTPRSASISCSSRN